MLSFLPILLDIFDIWQHYAHSPNDLYGINFKFGKDFTRINGERKLTRQW